MTQTARHMNGDMQQCIQECLTCHSVCLATVQYSMQMDPQRGAAQYMPMLLDCSEICQTSANFMLRGSTLHTRTCGICAEICTRCAEVCEHMGNDSQMTLCAKECRHCADACRQMATMEA